MNKKMQLYNRLHKLNTAQIITLGFAGVIILGGLLLWLPFCTAPGYHTSFTDAMFTATTSICVTGLVTVVTATHWTLAGKIIILVLIQIGGVGLISLGSIIFISLRKKISLRNRRVIQESYNMDRMGGMVRLVKKVLICVFGAEGIGAVCYAVRFIPQFGLAKGLGYSVFTAVSAFCNAGIDLLGEDSMAQYVADPIVNFTSVGLIIMSGLGFVVWWDIWDKIKRVIRGKLPVGRIFKNLRLHSKIVLMMTLILVVGGTVLIFLFDHGNPESIGTYSPGTKWMASLFQSVTTRTAGFFTVSQERFSNATYMLCLILMLIGGSPMGTAGGIKTTTVAVLLLSLKSNLQGKRDVEVHHRRIRDSYIRSAIVVTGMVLTVLILMSMLLCAAMPEAPIEDVVYEITSAVATVGLSRGLTLPEYSRQMDRDPDYVSGKNRSADSGNCSDCTCTENAGRFTSGRRRYYDWIVTVRQSGGYLQRITNTCSEREMRKKMKNKSYAVIGLGQFGMTVALTLAEANCDVLAIDDKDDNVQDIAEKVSYAVKADVRDPGILESLGVQNVDVAVIAVAENMEASITATMQVKELGVPFVMAKAMNSLHGRILEKIGADKVIYPEHSMGIRVARNLLSSGFVDMFELSSDFSMAEFKIPREWIGKTLRELKVREKYNINLIGLKHGDKMNMNVAPDEVFPADCTVVAAGANSDLNKVSEN